VSGDQLQITQKHNSTLHTYTICKEISISIYKKVMVIVHAKTLFV